MAVFEYRGILSPAASRCTASATPTTPRSLRAVLKREGILLTSAHEEAKASAGKKGDELEFVAFFDRVSRRRRRHDDAAARHAGRRGHPARRVGQRAHRAGREAASSSACSRRCVDRLNEGSSLAKALEAHPRVFPNLYMNMVAAGEASGTLEGVLERLADFMEIAGQAPRQGRRRAGLPRPDARHRHGAHQHHDDRRRPEGHEHLREPRPRAALVHRGAHRHVARSSRRNQMLGFVISMITFTFTRSALRDYKESERTKHMSYVIMSLVAGSLLILCSFAVESMGAYAVGVVLGLFAGLGIALSWRGSPRPRGARRRTAFLLKLPIFGRAAAHARCLALRAHAGDAAPERRAAAQGHGDRQERPRQRASSRRSSRRPPAAFARANRSPGRSSGAATSRRS